MRVLAICICVAFCACSKSEDYYPPFAIYEGISKFVMKHNGRDSFILDLSYRDRNGDLGHNEQASIYLYDTRNNSLLDTFIIPNLNISDRNFEQEGSISLNVPSPCCQVLPAGCNMNNEELFDSLYIKIILKDRQGKESEPVYTNKIRLQCAQ